MQPDLRVLLLLGSVVLLTATGSAEDAKPEDPDAERATHGEVAPLDVSFKRLSTRTLCGDGRLLAGDSGAKHLTIIAPDGRPTDTIDLPFGPESIAVAEDGAIYCGGEGQIALLDADGKMVKKVPVPEKQVAVDAQKGRPARTRARGEAVRPARGVPKERPHPRRTHRAL